LQFKLRLVAVIKNNTGKNLRIFLKFRYSYWLTKFIPKKNGNQKAILISQVFFRRGFSYPGLTVV
jgi:hypothetical protein